MIHDCYIRTGEFMIASSPVPVLLHSTSDVLIHTGDDAIAIKSGWDEFGYNYKLQRIVQQYQHP
jgi:hypothetical protein